MVDARGSRVGNGPAFGARTGPTHAAVAVGDRCGGRARQETGAEEQGNERKAGNSHLGVLCLPPWRAPDNLPF